MSTSRDTQLSSRMMESESSSNFQDFVETLKQFDVDDKGMVPAAELRHLLTALGDPLTEEEVEQVFEGQVNSDGQINIVNFVKHILES